MLAIAFTKVFSKGISSAEEEAAKYAKNQNWGSKIFEWALRLSFLAIPLGYQIVEKPDDPNFNKGL